MPPDQITRHNPNAHPQKKCPRSGSWPISNKGITTRSHSHERVIGRTLNCQAQSLARARALSIRRMSFLSSTDYSDA